MRHELHEYKDLVMLILETENLQDLRSIHENPLGYVKGDDRIMNQIRREYGAGVNLTFSGYFACNGEENVDGNLRTHSSLEAVFTIAPIHKR